MVSGALPVGAGAFAAAAADAAWQQSPAARSGGSILGWHAGAAAAEVASLPWVGPLLLAWRQVAHVLAPLFHPVRAPQNTFSLWNFAFPWQHGLPPPCRCRKTCDAQRLPVVPMHTPLVCVRDLHTRLLECKVPMSSLSARAGGCAPRRTGFGAAARAGRQRARYGDSRRGRGSGRALHVRQLPRAEGAPSLKDTFSTSSIMA